MKLFAHPVLCGLGVEAVLVGTFLLFPVGSCNAPLPGVAVLYLHYPGFLFSEHVLRFTSDRQHLVVAPIVMAAVWVTIFAAAGYIIRARARHRGRHDNAD